MSDASPGGIADLRPLEQEKEQKAWYWYDWANSAYITTIGTVFFGALPHRSPRTQSAATTGSASTSARSRCRPGRCSSGSSRSPRSCPRCCFRRLARCRRPHGEQEGAAGVLRLDRRPPSHRCSSSPTGDNWQIAAVGIVMAQPVLRRRPRSSTTRSCRSSPTRPTATASHRAAGPSATSAAACCSSSTSAVFLGHEAFGLEEGMAARICMLSAAVWWAGFTIIPFRRLKNHPPADVEHVEGNVVAPQLRPARGHAAGDEELPDGADLPAGLPVLQRRHPDGDRVGVRRTAPRSSATRRRSSSPPS